MKDVDRTKAQLIDELIEMRQRVAELVALETGREQTEVAPSPYADEQTALYVITAAVTTLLDQDELFATLFDVILPLLDVDAGWVTLSGHTPNDPPRIVVSRGVPESFLETEVAAHLRTCPICAHLLTRDGAQVEPQLMNQCPGLPPEALAAANLHGHVAIPLSSGGGVLGILNIVWRAPRTHPENHSLMMAVGQQVGMALHNVQLYQAASQVDRLRVLNELDQALAATLDPDAVAEATLYRIAAALRAPVGVLFVLPPGADAYPERALTLEQGWVEIETEKGAQGVRTFLQALQDGREIVSLSGDELVAYSGRPDLASRRGADGMAVPVTPDGELVAALVLGGRPTARPFTDEDRALAQAAANRAGQAIQNARLYKTTRARADELALLHNIGLALTSTLDYAEVVSVALSQVQRLFQAENVSLLQPDPRTGELCFVQALVDAKPVEVPVRLQPGEGITGWALEHRQPVLVDDAPRDPRFSARAAQYLGTQTRASMNAPLLAPERAIGVISVVSSKPGIYTRDNLHTLRAIAATLAVALENARLYEAQKALLREREQAQAQLIHSEKMAALGRLIASLAHEINNPLQALRSGLSLLSHHQVDESKRHQYLEVANREVERLITMIERVLEFYRPSSERPEPTDINAVLDETLLLVGKQLEQGRVIVHRRLAANLPPVEAVADQLEQVFLNLTLNALQAMPAGGDLTVRTSTGGDDNREEVRVAFTDTGVGIPDNKIPLLFEPFYAPQSRGAGLGLTISYSIVERHNGRIEVESEVGAGSTFTVVLPVVSDVACAEDAGSNPQGQRND